MSVFVLKMFAGNRAFLKTPKESLMARNLPTFPSPHMTTYEKILMKGGRNEVMSTMPATLGKPQGCASNP